MSSSRQDDVQPTFKPRDEIDELFGRANPNPERVGCPPREILIALARRERPLGDPAYEHLTKCSPCYLEVRSIQEVERQQRRRRLFQLVAWTSAAAAVVLAAVVAGWMFLGSAGRKSVAEVRTELDLRPYALTRGASQPGNLPPLSLQRGRAMLTIILPAGSEPGAYEVQILDSGLASRASGAGTADLRDHMTTLQTGLDAGSLSPGAYQLAIRRSGEEWQLFPAHVQ